MDRTSVYGTDNEGSNPFIFTNFLSGNKQSYFVCIWSTCLEVRVLLPKQKNNIKNFRDGQIGKAALDITLF